jgi:hypothetical protein
VNAIELVHSLKETGDAWLENAVYYLQILMTYHMFGTKRRRCIITKLAINPRKNIQQGGASRVHTNLCRKDNGQRQRSEIARVETAISWVHTRLDLASMRWTYV